MFKNFTISVDECGCLCMIGIVLMFVEAGLYIFHPIACSIVGVVAIFLIASWIIWKIRRSIALTRAEEILKDIRETQEAREREERARQEAAKQKKDQEQQAQDIAEFARVLQLCREKNINLFDYIAAQEKSLQPSLFAQLKVCHFEEFWAGKADLPLWTGFWCRPQLVFTTTCSDFQEFDKLFKLIGVDWFSRTEIQQAYVNSATDILEKYRVINQLEIRNYIKSKEATPLFQECLCRLAEATTKTQVDRIKPAANTFLNWAAFRTERGQDGNHYELERQLEHTLAKTLLRINHDKAGLITGQVKTIDDAESLAGLLKMATKIADEANDLRQKLNRSETVDNQKEFCVAVPKMITEKILSVCSSPVEIKRLIPTNKNKRVHWTIEKAVTDWIDAWYIAAINACTDLQVLELLASAMDQDDRRDHSCQINKRSVELRLA